MTCPYINSLDRPCGRPTDDEFCPFHAVLNDFETNCGDPAALREAVLPCL